MRIAALVAIALMILTVIICLFVILSDNSVAIDPSSLIVGAPVEVDDSDNSMVSLLFSVIFLLALFVLIFVIAMREHKKNKSNEL